MRQMILVCAFLTRLLGYNRFMRTHGLIDLKHRIKILPCGAPTHPRPKEEILEALDIACALYPVRVMCLQRSTVLVATLRHFGYSAQLCIGVQTSPFRAHAWVSLDNEPIHDTLTNKGAFIVMEVC